MKRKRTKAYWLKKREVFEAGPEAKSRAGLLRSYEHVQHVTVDRTDKEYVVNYSIAKWFLEDCERAGVKL